jgi:DNA-binding Lrp family transcriptional regulator
VGLAFDGRCTIDRTIQSRYIRGQKKRRPAMSACVFIQIRCLPGQTYKVADAIYEREVVSELYSTSGDFDLLMKVYVPEESDIGRFVNEKILDIPGISRSLTTLTFKAF